MTQEELREELLEAAEAVDQGVAIVYGSPWVDPGDIELDVEAVEAVEKNAMDIEERVDDLCERLRTLRYWALQYKDLATG